MDEIGSAPPQAPASCARVELISNGDGERLFPFQDRIEIGRWSRDREGREGIVPVKDATVSSVHCVIVRRRDGGYFVRDLSRNGTWLDGRRLVPNVQVSIAPGQVLSVGHGNHVVLRDDGFARRLRPSNAKGGTQIEANETLVTVLVGDIRHYTNLVREVPAATLQGAVSAVFEELEAEVIANRGSVKEYQGDAIFAFWEDRASVDCAESACRAALALDRTATRLANDPLVWDVPGHALRLDWALATGPVVIRAHGEGSTMGLSMIGEAVPLAFRIEKLANDDTGPILVCEETWSRAEGAFEFRDLGRREAKGFEELPRIFSLQGESRSEEEA